MTNNLDITKHAIAQIDRSIKDLMLARNALAAALPTEPKRRTTKKIPTLKAYKEKR